MSGSNPKSTPIALILGGSGILIAIAYSAFNALAQHVDTTTVGVLATVFGIIGVIVIGVGAYLWYWEREQHYRWSLNP